MIYNGQTFNVSKYFEHDEMQFIVHLVMCSDKIQAPKPVEENLDTIQEVMKNFIK